MTKPFARKFDLNQLPKENPEWWQDLLQRLMPAGEELGDFGLRLAVRENYLNFYHRGQAIAYIGFNRKKELYSKLHIKYVFPGAKPQKYVKLNGNEPGIINPENEKDSVSYQGSQTLKKWIGCAKDTKIKDDDEKSFVEKVVAANGDVVDMEVGLPGKAYRIDLVSLEQRDGLVHIVFWEAKLTTDKRWGPDSDISKVLEQLGRYRAFLNSDNRQKQLKVAFVNACQVLTKITKLANKSVASIIEDVANMEEDESGDIPRLVIDSEPRLLIYYNEVQDKKNNWSRYEKKLIENKVTMQIMTEGSCYKLQSKEQF